MVLTSDAFPYLYSILIFFLKMRRGSSTAPHASFFTLQEKAGPLIPAYVGYKTSQIFNKNQFFPKINKKLSFLFVRFG